MSVQCPSYISARSAEVILSDVRPIKLKPDALHSINVVIDEILYSILAAARSLATDKLKAALIKVLPTSLGKEALLEAEVELKAYWDRAGVARPSTRGGGDSAVFDLQWSFELLRLKCEAYSTMNDSDEDAEAEKRLQRRMEEAGSSSPPNPVLLAPAALYLTAILEAICEHVLSNVSRVAARDSSRTVATIQDLFTALGEDDTIYAMFKAMKVYEHIESLSKAQRPRRSKSFSRSTDKAIAPRTSTSSPFGGESTASTTTTTAPAGPGRSRMSTESQKSTVVGSSESRRTSMEKVKGTKIFHTRTLSDKQEPAISALARSQSENGINREQPEFEEDEELQQEFDELMRSGATMKVSLTPDRLKSMEVYKQERSERERLNRRGGQAADKGQDGGVAATLPTEHKRGTTANGRGSVRHVDSIIEDEEESSNSNHHVSSPPFQSNAAARTRNISFTASSATATARANDQRLRSISISNVPHPRYEDGIARKTSTSMGRQANGNGASAKIMGSQNSAPASPQVGMGMPKRTRRQPQKRRESMDLDEVMAGSGGEEEEIETVAAVVVPPKTGRVTAPATPSKPHISKAAQDLIAFLEAGPPEDPGYNPTMNASVISFESSKTRSGRLQRMMSKLTLGGSRESLNGSIAEESPKTPRSLGRKNSKINMASSPPPSFKGGSLQGKRSIPNVNSNPYPNVVVATPPPRPPIQMASASLLTSPSISNSSSTHTSTEDVVLSPSQTPSLSRRHTRKAVPLLDGAAASPTSSVATESLADGKPLANGHRNARVADDSRDGSLAASPISPVAKKPVVLSGHPVKIDTSDSSLHPNSRTGNVISPTSTLDRKSVHAKAESGTASRSASRSPITPSERLPPTGAPAAPPAPTIPPADVDDLRRLLNVATSADECRLIVDMFLLKNRFAVKEPVAAEAATTSKATLEDALVLAAKGVDEVERGEQALVQAQGRYSRSHSRSPSLSRSLSPSQLQNQNRSRSQGKGMRRDASQSRSRSRIRSLSRESSLNSIPFAPAPLSPVLARIDRRLSVMVPRMSVDQHILNLYRIYQNGLGLDPDSGSSD